VQASIPCLTAMLNPTVREKFDLPVREFSIDAIQVQQD
jgi:hypothetical protein